MNERRVSIAYGAVSIFMAFGSAVYSINLSHIDQPWAALSSFLLALFAALYGVEAGRRWERSE